MSPVSSRYIRAIYLLPGVKGGSEKKKGQRVLRKQEKERTFAVDRVVQYRCFTVVSWGHAVLYCCFTVVSWSHGGQKK